MVDTNWDTDTWLKSTDVVLAIKIIGHSECQNQKKLYDGCNTAAKLLGRLARERRKKKEQQQGEPKKTVGLLDLLAGTLDEPWKKYQGSNDGKWKIAK